MMNSKQKKNNGRRTVGLALAAVSTVGLCGSIAPQAHAVTPVQAVATGAPASSPAASSTVTLVARADLAYGAGADLQVKVGGTVIGSVTVTSTSWATYSLPIPAGVSTSNTTLEVFFDNDAYGGPTNDRNAYLQAVTFGGTPVSLNNVTYDKGNDWTTAEDGQGIVSTSSGELDGNGAFKWQGLTAKVTPTPVTAPVLASPASMGNALYAFRNSNGSTYYSLSKGNTPYGYSTTYGRVGKVSASPAAGLTPVHQLYSTAKDDYLYVTEGDSELTTAVKSYGYQDQGIKFYASRASASGLTPVTRLQKANAHVYTASTTEAASLKTQGWTSEGVRFYATPAEAVPEEPAAGSLPVGQAVYDAPSDALYVSPSGSDSNSGTLDAPFKTIAKAVSTVASGGTIVLRGGTYHEDLDYISKTITLQNAPGEAAWLDGSESISNWTQAGSTWTTPYAYNFDASPTFTKGAADGTTAGWQFVNPSEPMAAHPDQVWVDGVKQEQVSSADQVSAGKFFVDANSKQLLLGTNPNGHKVEVSTLQQAFRLGGDGSVVRGIGIRNYANSQPMMGSVVSYANNATFENVDVEGAATTGLGIYRAGNKVTNVTVNNSGSTGLAGNNADGLVVNHVRLTNANNKKFNFAPVEGGMKVSRTAGLTLENSVISDNYATGFWTDEDDRDVVVANNTFLNNARNGLMLELTARATVVNNTFTNNGSQGNESIFVSDTNKASLWNNTVKGPRTAIRLGQDSRTRANQPGVGDKRTGAIDSDMTWQTANTVIQNNVLEDDGSGNATLPEGRGNVNNYAIIHGQNYKQGANPDLQMVASEDGNVLARTSTGTPQFAVVWANAGKDFTAYNTWEAFRAAQGSMDAHSYYRTGSVFNSDGTVDASALSQATASQVPASVAAAANTTLGGVGAAS